VLLISKLCNIAIIIVIFLSQPRRTAFWTRQTNCDCVIAGITATVWTCTCIVTWRRTCLSAAVITRPTRHLTTPHRLQLYPLVFLWAVRQYRHWVTVIGWCGRKTRNKMSDGLTPIIDVVSRQTSVTWRITRNVGWVECSSSSSSVKPRWAFLAKLTQLNITTFSIFQPLL